jgi:hypothetical protein
MVYWYNNRAHILQLGENVIHLDSWKEDMFTKMMTQIKNDLEYKEEALVNLQEVV